MNIYNTPYLQAVKVALYNFAEQWEGKCSYDIKAE